MIQEFKDEILDTSGQLDNKPRYRIRDNNGTVIYDNVTLEVATPVVQEGMNINKAKVENLQGDLYTQDRYNIPSYSGTAMTLNLPLTSYEVGKIIKIKAPATLSNPTLNINGLGAKTVNLNIAGGYKYILIYNGTSFDVIESIPISTQAQATTGTDNHTVMTPLRVKQAINSYAMPSKNISIATGTISNGGTIPQTTGYSNYAYFVSISEGQATKEQGQNSPAGDTRLTCKVNQSTRKVTALVYACSVSSYDGHISWESEYATANYIEFAWN